MCSSDSESEFYGFEDEEVVAPPPEIIKSSRNNDMLAYRGFLYHQNRKPVKETYYWECKGRKHASRGKRKCPARLITVKSNESHRVISQGEHSHEYDPIYIAQRRFGNAVKRRAEEDSSAPAKILRLTSSSFPNAVQQKLSINAQRHLVRRIRQHSVTRQIDPETLDSYTIPDGLRNTIDGDMFFQADIVEGSNRAMLFCTRADLRRLSLSKYWVADGTFETAPGLFRQLFTIEGSCGPTHESAFPLVFVLVTAKNECLYRAVLSKLIELAEEDHLDLNPNVVLSDFEKGIINSFKEEFPEATHSGCFFHLSKNWWKYIQQNKLLDVLNKNEEFFIFYKKVQALAFLPVTKIPDAFQKIKSSAPDQLHGFFKYIEEVYVVGRVRKINQSGRVSTIEPAYPPSLLSIYDNVINNIPRTTNQLEAWHGRWKGLVGKKPSIAGIIKELRLEQKDTAGQVMALLAGTTNKRRRPVDQERDAKIRRIVQHFDAYDEEDYIDAISANLGSSEE